MELQQIKETLNKIEFSPESLALINQIMDEAIRNGTLTEESKTKLLGIIDVEIEMDNIQEEALKDISVALAGYEAELDRAEEILEEDLKTAQDNFTNNQPLIDDSDTE